MPEQVALGSWCPAGNRHELAWFGYKRSSPFPYPDAIVDGRGAATPIIQDRLQVMLFVLDLCRLLWVHQCALPTTYVLSVLAGETSCVAPSTRRSRDTAGGLERLFLPISSQVGIGCNDTSWPLVTDNDTDNGEPPFSADGIDVTVDTPSTPVSGFDRVKRRIPTRGAAITCKSWFLGLVLLSQLQRGWGVPMTNPLGSPGYSGQGTLVHPVLPVRGCSHTNVGARVARERPIPTPCRSRDLGGPRALEICVGPTLLEQAMRLSEGKPFWEAATLLDVLFEHWALDARGLDCKKGGSTHTLSLCAAIAPPRPDLTPRDVVVLAGLHWQPLVLTAAPTRDFGNQFGPVLLGGLRMEFSYQDLRALLETACQPAALHHAIRLSPAAEISKLFSVGADATGLTSSGIHCFTDGSFTAPRGGRQAKLGWACVFVDPARHRIGLLSGRRPSWLPDASDPPSAFVAECLALETALRVCGTALWHVPVIVRSDCFSAIEIAAGRARSSGDGVAGVLRHAGSFGRAAARYPPVLEHVRGHAGCLFNEVADVVAKLAANGHDLGVFAKLEGDDPFWWAHNGRALDWAGVACQCASNNPCLPALGAAPRLCHSDAGLAPLQLIEPFLPFVRPEGGDERRTGSLHLCLVTYNVLSLCGKAFQDDRTAGLAFVPARPAILAKALHACGVSVAGVQEARTEEGRLTTEGFLRICSGAVKGQFGVELWFKVQCPVVACDGDGSALVTFEPSAFTVLHADPRRLFVLFSAADVRLLFVSLHAPHRGAEGHILDGWWAGTRQLLEKHASRGLVFLLGDFNASVGSFTSCSVGDHAADAQDAAGDYLHDILQRLSLWLPSTFSSVHEGPSGTYVQKRNQAESRIDFVAIPGMLAQSQVWSWVEPSIHAGQPIIDHLASLVSVCARNCHEQEPA